MPSASSLDITPLRIQKGTVADPESDSKLPTTGRPLSDISPMEGRRNSTTTTSRAGGDNDDLLSSSPFPSPPPNGKAISPSPRTFWQGRDQQGSRDNSPSVARRSSIERLKRASRVQNNSKLFNKSDSKIVRPASYHPPQAPVPFSTPVFSRTGSVRVTAADRDRSRIPLPSPRKTDAISRALPVPLNARASILSAPSRASPTKSSLLSSYKTNSYDSEDDTSRKPARRPKSVSWDKDEPHVLEYELVTPDPSVVGSPSAEYDSDDYEDEDEDDLENTPVIEPDGWRGMPEPVPLPDHDELPYQTTPSPNGGRPLPPIPGLPRADSASPSGARPLPTLPLTKAELQNQAVMPMEERMRRMMEGNDPTRRLSWDPVNRRRSRQGIEFGEGLGIVINKGVPAEDDQDAGSGTGHMSPVLQDESTTSDRDESSPNSNREHDGESSVTTSQYESSHTTYESSISEYEPPQLSRESIRRQVEERRHQHAQEGGEQQKDRRESARYTYYSSSDHADHTDDEESYVKSEPTDDSEHDDDVDLYPLPEMQKVSARPASRFATRAPDPDQMTESESSVYGDHGDDEASQYSVQVDDEQSDTPRQGNTPVPGSPASTATAELEPAPDNQLADTESHDDAKVSLPELSSLDIGLGLAQYMTPSPPATISEPEELSGPSASTAREFFAQQDMTADEEEESEEESDTGSVIRHPVTYSDDDYEEYDSELDEEDGHGGEETHEGDDTRTPSPVAESIATIRAPGGKLKTRASATPADMAAMAAARRHVSGDQRNPPPAPRIRNGYRSEGDSSTGESSDEEDPTGNAAGQSDSEAIGRRVSGARRRKVSTALPALGEFEFDLKLDDLNDEFDRVIEKQKRGYLMRQNTKVIHASSRDLDSDNNPTPDRPGHARGQSWSVEPWRSSNRRRSHRDSSLRKRPSNGGPVPPLPGREGVTTTTRLPSVSETGRSSSVGSAVEGENVERGRLFVKVVGVKDLTLPLPQGQPTYFCLTLDNGLHCVTTSWLELGKNAPIGQEFELVVLNDLEFQLTLQTKLEQPPQPPKTATKPPVVKPLKTKQSTFSKVFSTPKRRKQLELQQQQAAQQQQQLQRQQTQEAAPATAWDLLHGLVARDGSFARSYVCLKDFESRAYGRALTTDIHCFNEWAVDTASLKGKKGIQGGLQPARKAPYKIGKLEMQLFFVPKPKGASDKDLPKSMNTATRELRDAESIMSREWEGNLSQQGGDCPFWRRRYFKLKGPRLTAYHEATRQPRATINLSKAVKLIDDRRTLVENTVAGPGKTRRKSGFSEDEEGYMFVEEGFRIRFANGEVIDFYADSADEKRAWLRILGETIGHVPDSRGWCQMVLAKEAKIRAEREKHEMAAEKLRAAQLQMRQQQQQQQQQQQPPRAQIQAQGHINGPQGTMYRPPPPANPNRRPVPSSQSPVYR